VTTDGGKTWRAGVVPGTEELQFRDVEGVSERVAYLMSADTGTASRIYKTVDGGATWTMQFQNHNPRAFYDCFAFWDQKSGVTFSDAVDGVFPVIRTTDGKTWQNIGARLPAAQDGEAAFAASGTCVATQGGSAPGSPPAARPRRGSWRPRTVGQLEGVRHADHPGHADLRGAERGVPGPPPRHPRGRRPAQLHPADRQRGRFQGRRGDVDPDDADAVRERGVRPRLRAGLRAADRGGHRSCGRGLVAR
jgi:hypothetical protein